MDPYAYALYNPQFGLPLLAAAAGGGGGSSEVLEDWSRWSHSALAAVPAALDHYKRVGRHWHEPVLCARIPLLVRLHPVGGLCNMVTSTVTALALAVALGGNVALSDVHRRRSFELSSAKSWDYAPFGSLFNQPAIIEALAELGVHAVAKAVPTATVATKNSNRVQFNDSRALAMHVAYQERDREQKADDTKGEMISYDLSELVRNLTQGIVRAATEEQAARARKGHAVACDDPPTVILKIHSLALLRTAGLPLAVHLMRSLRFSDVVEQRAQQVADAMAARGFKDWNGMHLRLEGDNAKMTTDRFGGLNGTLQMYAELCRRMGGWGAHTPVYLASGLFTYAEGIQTFEEAVEILREAGVGTVFLHKELFEADESLPSSSSTGPSGGSTHRRLPALDSEQAAAVDMLVLQRATRFVGITGTSYTWHLAQRRLLEGRSPRHQAIVRYCRGCRKGEGIDAHKLAKSYLESCPVMQCAEDAQQP